MIRLFAWFQENEDEVDSNIIVEPSLLKPKMYRMGIYNEEKEKTDIVRRAKGKPTRQVEQRDGIDEYRTALYKDTKSDAAFNTRRSSEHQVYPITCTKIGLSQFDDKRYYTDRVSSYAHGHYKIKMTNRCL